MTRKGVATCLNTFEYQISVVKIELLAIRLLVYLVTIDKYTLTCCFHPNKSYNNNLLQLTLKVKVIKWPSNLIGSYSLPCYNCTKIMKPENVQH